MRSVKVVILLKGIKQLPREKRERNSEEKAAARKKGTKGLLFKKKEKLRVRIRTNNLGFKCLSCTQI